VRVVRVQLSCAAAAYLISYYNMSVSYYNIQSPWWRTRIASSLVFIIIIFTPVAGSWWSTVRYDRQTGNYCVPAADHQLKAKGNSREISYYILYYNLILYRFARASGNAIVYIIVWVHGTWNMVTTTSAHKSYHTTNVIIIIIIIIYCTRMVNRWNAIDSPAKILLTVRL